MTYSPQRRSRHVPPLRPLVPRLVVPISPLLLRSTALQSERLLLFILIRDLVSSVVVEAILEYFVPPYRASQTSPLPVIGGILAFLTYSKALPKGVVTAGGEGTARSVSRSH